MQPSFPLPSSLPAPFKAFPRSSFVPLLLIKLVPSHRQLLFYYNAPSSIFQEAPDLFA